VVGPTNKTTWSVVGADSDRLLKIWVAKEKDEAAATVAQQISDLLRELAAAEDGVGPIPSVPAPLTILPAPVTDVAAAAPILTVADVVTHVPEPVISTPGSLKSLISESVKTAPVEEEEEGYEVEEEEEEGSKPPSDDEGEVIEPEAAVAEEEEEEEEEVGMEVEQITIRGRTWWLEVNTQKIYAVVDGDDVGDEMGEMVAGKPRFYAK
jgi:hypothetical protein